MNYLDYEKIKELREIDTDTSGDFIKSLIEVFTADFIYETAQIKEYFKYEKYSDIKQSAHKLKSTAGNLGATQLYNMLTRLEIIAIASNKSEIQQMINQIEIDFKITLDALKKEIIV